MGGFSLGFRVSICIGWFSLGFGFSLGFSLGFRVSLGIGWAGKGWFITSFNI